KATKWWGKYKDHNDKERRVPLYADKETSRAELAELVRKAARAKAGYLDPRFDEHLRRPLAEHLADYRRDLEDRNNDPRYVRLVHSRLTALLDGCGFRLMADLDANRVMNWLADLRRKGEPRAPLPEGKDLFTMKEVLLVITLPSVSDAIERHRIEVIHQKKRRLLPRAAVEMLQD